MSKAKVEIETAAAIAEKEEVEGATELKKEETEGEVDPGLTLLFEEVSVSAVILALVLIYCICGGGLGW